MEGAFMRKGTQCHENSYAPQTKGPGKVAWKKWHLSDRNNKTDRGDLFWQKD